MRSVVIFGARGWVPSPGRDAVTVDGATVGCGLAPTPAAAFRSESPEHATAVLVRVTALSCNYRDRTFVRGMAAVPSHRYSAMGSDFAGEVVAVGSAVRAFRAGDRVVPDHHFTGDAAGAGGVRGGVATNQASRRLQLLPAGKLLPIPPGVSDEAAAALGLNAQTAYSVVRRMGLARGARALVTAGGSNTSLLVMGALRARGVRVYVTTTSAASAARLDAAGAAGVAVVERGAGRFRASDALASLATRAGGFDGVFDPFFDLHLEGAVEVMNPSGVYVTCGLAAQNAGSAAAAGVGAAPIDAVRVLHTAILRNLTIVGNCLGHTDDLRAALRDHAAGELPVTIDDVFTGDRVAPFLDRTFNASGRFGKVVYRYAE